MVEELRRCVRKGDTLLHVTVRAAREAALPQTLRCVDFLVE